MTKFWRITGHSNQNRDNVPLGPWEDWLFIHCKLGLDWSNCCGTRYSNQNALLPHKLDNQQSHETKVHHNHNGKHKL